MFMLSGALSDMSGDYQGAFYMAGGAIALSGLICFPLRRISAWENGRFHQEQPDLTQSRTILVEQHFSTSSGSGDDTYSTYM